MKERKEVLEMNLDCDDKVDIANWKVEYPCKERKL